MLSPTDRQDTLSDHSLSQWLIRGKSGTPHCMSAADSRVGVSPLSHRATEAELPCLLLLPLKCHSHEELSAGWVHEKQSRIVWYGRPEGIPIYSLGILPSPSNRSVTSTVGVLSVLLCLFPRRPSVSSLLTRPGMAPA